MPYQFIDARESDGVLIVTMDDPPTRNAIGDEMAGEINQELDRLEASPDLRTVVITGRDPSFCSGANVKRMDDANRSRTAESPLPGDRSPWEVLAAAWEELGAPGPAAAAVDGVRFVPLRLHQLQKPSDSRRERLRHGSGHGYRAVLRHPGSRPKTRACPRRSSGAASFPRTAPAGSSPG